MHRKNLNLNPQRRKGRRGQALVESALIMLVFLLTLIATLDFSQVLFTHQTLVERTRSGLRWGIIHSWDGTGDGIANIILYGQSAAKSGGGTFLGLKRDNIRVTYNAPTVDNPNDIRLQVAIVNYQFQFVTPFIAKTFTNNHAVVESAPILYRN